MSSTPHGVSPINVRSSPSCSNVANTFSETSPKTSSFSSRRRCAKALWLRQTHLCRTHWHAALTAQTVGNEKIELRAEIELFVYFSIQIQRHLGSLQYVYIVTAHGPGAGSLHTREAAVREANRRCKVRRTPGHQREDDATPPSPHASEHAFEPCSDG